MAMLKRTPWILIFFVLIGGLLGGVLGEILRLFSPEGLLKEMFLKGYSIGLNPPGTLDLHIITFTLGFTIQMNLFSLIGIIFGIYIYKQA
jgi:hypothetical protein